MRHEVKLGQREATLVVSKRYPVRLSQIGGVLGAAFGEVYGHLGSRGAATVGPPFVIYYGAPEGDLPFDVEVCAPIARPVEPPPGWEVRELPAGTFATVLHVGPYDAIATAYEAITTWIGEHELVIAGPPREVYLSAPTVPPEQTRTIIEFPVAPLQAAVPAR